jgi:bifunctional non-homologous end joining protein LigD
MAKPPRRPREIKRSAEASEALTSRVQVPRRDPRQVELFRTSFIEPCKPTLRQRAPSGPGWQFEIKHDGYRAQCHLSAGEVRIYTKNGHDIAARLPSISAALAALPVDDALIDGEAVMVGSDGITDFFTLHAAVSAKSAPAALLYAFDLLHLDGQDLRSLPLDERRLLLEDLLLYVADPLRFSEHVLGDGPSVVRAACDLGLEGIVAKVRDAPYRSGRGETWLKIKCTKTAEFVVTGFEPDGHAPSFAPRTQRYKPNLTVQSSSASAILRCSSRWGRVLAAQSFRAALSPPSPYLWNSDTAASCASSC